MDRSRVHSSACSLLFVAIRSQALTHSYGCCAHSLYITMMKVPTLQVQTILDTDCARWNDRTRCRVIMTHILCSQRRGDELVNNTLVPQWRLLRTDNLSDDAPWDSGGELKQLCLAHPFSLFFLHTHTYTHSRAHLWVCYSTPSSSPRRAQAGVALHHWHTLPLATAH